jgi:hypothetical protein
LVRYLTEEIGFQVSCLLCISEISMWTFCRDPRNACVTIESISSIICNLGKFKFKVFHALGLSVWLVVWIFMAWLGASSLVQWFVKISKMIVPTLISTVLKQICEIMICYLKWDRRTVH